VPLRVRAVKGPEYEPFDREVTLGAGQMALRFAVRRWSDVAAEGWYAGDSRVHFVPPHDALLEAAAEDVSVVNLLACAQPFPSLDGTAYPTVPNIAAFSGQAPALGADGRMVVVNTLNAHPVLGRVGLLNCHRAVFPLTFGGDEETDDWSVTDWCHQCHRKQGLAVWVDAFRDAGGFGGEALVAAVLGAIDAIEFGERPPLAWWYRLLNAGVRLPPVGGSGKDSNRMPIGAMRTYAKLDPGEPLTYKAWVEAVRAGRTVVTNGPLVRFDAAGRASAESFSPFERLEVVADGRVIAAAAAGPGARWAATADFAPPADCGWLAARCVGGPAFAHTAPVYVGRIQPRGTDAAPLRRCVEETRDWVEQHSRFAEEKRKRKLLDLCDQALARLISGGPPG
jgi:hypothetical protein